MVTLVIGNVYSRLVSKDVSVVHTVADRLAVPVKGAKYTRWFKSGRWDGRHRFLERPSNRFLTGLLSVVKSTLAFHEVDYWIDDRREWPQPLQNFPIWSGPPLRAYQTGVVAAASKASRGILRVGTGGGKTIVAGKLIADLGVRTLFFVHRKELAEQVVSRFREWFGPAAVGLAGAGRIADEGQLIVVGMIQTVHAFLKRDPTTARRFLNGFALVIADECHRAGADTWSRVLQWTPAYYRFGLSGTPLVSDDVRDLTLQGLTGGLVADVSAAELAEAGWLAKPICRFLAYEDPSNGTERKAGYQDAYARLIINNRARNRLTQTILDQHPDAQVLLIVKRILHGDHLRGELRDPPLFVSGQEADAWRHAIYAAFRAGRIRRLIASTIYDEGVDFPALDVVVNLAGGKTIVPLFQRLGRAMHRKDTTQPVYYYDFCDEGNRYLKAHYLRRLHELRNAGFEVVTQGGE